jgi:hypothetical protein
MAAKMNIYIRIDSDDSGYRGWWSFGIDGWSYLVDGHALWTVSKITGEEYSRGTACTSIKQAKREAKIACSTANSDGIVDPKISFWRQVGDKLIQTKFTRDNKLKQLAKPIVLKGKDVFEPWRK